MGMGGSSNAARARLALPQVHQTFTTLFELNFSIVPTEPLFCWVQRQHLGAALLPRRAALEREGGGRSGAGITGPEVGVAHL